MRRLVALLLLLSAAACEVAPEVTSTRPGVEAAVVRVGDGDSLTVALEGAEYDLRLIGINAPERDECFGAEARSRLAELVEGATVILRADQEEADQYGRLLRYVYVDGRLVNEMLVAEGYVMARSYPPNLSLQSLLDEAQNRARNAGAGLWEACASSRSDLRIVEVNADAPGSDDENLNGEWVVITNRSEVSVDLSGWTLRDAESANRYEFPGSAVVPAGGTVLVFTGCGTDSAEGLFWCSSGPVWNNRGDVAYLIDPDGKIVDRLEY